MLVVDSSVLIAWLRNTPTPQTAYLKSQATDQPILLGDLILMEVLQGARSHDDAARIERRLRSFEVVGMVDHGAAEKAAEHYRTLRQLGITIRKQVDLLIGTFCIAHDHELLHADRDFEPMARHLGLKVADGPPPVH